MDEDLPVAAHGAGDKAPGPPADVANGAGPPNGRAAIDDPDAGMSTVEYAVGTIAAAAFAAVLYQVVTGSSVLSGLTSLVQQAFSAL